MTEQELNDLVDAYRLMEKYNITVRRIPNVTVSTFHPRHFKHGDEVITRTYDDYKNPVLTREQFDKEHPGGWRLCKRTRVPKNAGKWMAQVSNHTYSIIKWDGITAYDTLPEAVKAAVEEDL